MHEPRGFGRAERDAGEDTGRLRRRREAGLGLVGRVTLVSSTGLSSVWFSAY